MERMTRKKAWVAREFSVPASRGRWTKQVELELTRWILGHDASENKMFSSICKMHIGIMRLWHGEV